MQTILFHETIFGPVHSRRLGVSLGVNLSPVDGKVCTFDCLYCEAGYNAQGPGQSGLPDADNVLSQLDERLSRMSQNGEPLDVITFSGNGEPTLHPEFPRIIDGVIAIRDKYFPKVKISVLTNSTRLHNSGVAEALRRVDNNIAKLDSAIQETIVKLDRPTVATFTADKVISHLAQFAGQVIIQTMFTRGHHETADGASTYVDNTTDSEVTALIEAYRLIRPKSIMIYSLDRPTPEHSLEKISHETLQSIADRIVAETAIPVSIA
jgi:wyosine [tRNA(Phe)-imidazoG37] synthetase (radical SAM superfamily)